jgi:hypothetical protein
LRTEEGLRRLPLIFFEESRAFPQYAGTRQPVTSFRRGKIEGTDFVEFDATGRWDGLSCSENPGGVFCFRYA